jgi:hypothetical protein
MRARYRFATLSTCRGDGNAASQRVYIAEDGYGSNPVVEACLRHVRFTPILLQKSPRESCRIETRNNRIETNGFLNQRCACAPDVESMLLAQMRKIFLQHYRPVSTFKFCGLPPAFFAR